MRIRWSWNGLRRCSSWSFTCALIFGVLNGCLALNFLCIFHTDLVYLLHSYWASERRPLPGRFQRRHCEGRYCIPHLIAGPTSPAGTRAPTRPPCRVCGRLGRRLSATAGPTLHVRRAVLLQRSDPECCRHSTGVDQIGSYRESFTQLYQVSKILII